VAHKVNNDVVMEGVKDDIVRGKKKDVLHRKRHITYNQHACSVRIDKFVNGPFVRTLFVYLTFQEAPPCYKIKNQDTGHKNIMQHIYKINHKL